MSMNRFYKYYCDSDIDGANEYIKDFYNDFRQFYLYLKEKNKDKFEQRFLDMMEDSDMDLNKNDKDVISINEFRIKYI